MKNYVQICTSNCEQYVQMCIICTASADIVKKHVVLDTGLYNLGQADMRWRLYGVEVTVSTLLLPNSSSDLHLHHHHHHHHYKGNS